MKDRNTLLFGSVFVLATAAIAADHLRHVAPPPPATAVSAPAVSGNPCAANPCAAGAAVNPCAAGAATNPCAANPCAAAPAR